MKIFKRILLILLAFVLIYVVTLFNLPKITIRSETIHQLREINVFIKSSGIHANIVMPIKNKFFNWNTIVKQKQTLQAIENMNYVEIGWEDKRFYLNRSTCNDSTFKTAFKTSFGLSINAIHVTYFKKILENEKCVKLSLISQQYKKLGHCILESGQIENNEFVKIKANNIY